VARHARNQGTLFLVVTSPSSLSGGGTCTGPLVKCPLAVRRLVQFPGALISRSEYWRSHWHLAASRWGSRAPGVQAHCCDSHKTIWVRSTFSSRTSLTRILYPQTAISVSFVHLPICVVSDASRVGMRMCFWTCQRSRCAAPKMSSSRPVPYTTPTNIDTMLRYSNAYLTHISPSHCTLRVRWLGMRILLSISRRLACFQ
jgi:hypothetical protein